MKTILVLCMLLCACLAMNSCSSHDYAANPEGVMHVYGGAGGEAGGWIFVYGSKEYPNVETIPNKGEITRAVVKSKTTGEEQKALSESLRKAFGEKLEIVFPADNYFLPPVYRRPIISRPVIF